MIRIVLATIFGAAGAMTGAVLLSRLLCLLTGSVWDDGWRVTTAGVAAVCAFTGGICAGFAAHDAAETRRMKP